MSESRKGIIKRGELFMIGKKNGDSVLYLGLMPIPHWASKGPFTWRGTYTEAKKVLRQTGGGLYSTMRDQP